ncbi:hypothetical protein Moror_9856 [Moniliophthora roreri MCA 2997]|uniref:Uncharacterized protein n=1 Tax=Moniliophthora roreri (strain MCA 2997) TaxID=1381753 RepID=V2X206_MONRO|nr:hypothetical protein Moror_9856 [Moniliophthora roreri MCA 2997]
MHPHFGTEIQTMLARLVTHSTLDLFEEVALAIGVAADVSHANPRSIRADKNSSAIRGVALICSTKHDTPSFSNTLLECLPSLDLLSSTLVSAGNVKSGPVSARGMGVLSLPTLPNVGSANIGDVKVGSISLRDVGLVNLGDVTTGSISVRQLPNAGLVNTGDVASVLLTLTRSWKSQVQPFLQKIGSLRPVLAEVNAALSAATDKFQGIADATAPLMNAVFGTLGDALKRTSSANVQSVTDLFAGSCNPLDGLLQSINSLVGGTFTSTITLLISDTLGVLARLDSPSNFDFLGDLVGKASFVTCLPYPSGQRYHRITNLSLIVAEVNTVLSAAVQASINANMGGSDDVSAADVAGVTAPLVNAVLSALGDALKLASPAFTYVSFGSIATLTAVSCNLSTPLLEANFFSTIAPMIINTLALKSTLGGADSFDFLGQFNVQDLSGKVVASVSGNM